MSEQEHTMQVQIPFGYTLRDNALLRDPQADPRIFGPEPSSQTATPRLDELHAALLAARAIMDDIYQYASRAAGHIPENLAVSDVARLVDDVLSDYPA